MLTFVGVAARSDTYAQAGKGDAGEGNCVLQSEIHPQSMPDYFGWPKAVAEFSLNPVVPQPNSAFGADKRPTGFCFRMSPRRRM